MFHVWNEEGVVYHALDENLLFWGKAHDGFEMKREEMKKSKRTVALAPKKSGMPSKSGRKAPAMKLLVLISSRQSVKRNISQGEEGIRLYIPLGCRVEYELYDMDSKFIIYYMLYVIHCTSTVLPSTELLLASSIKRITALASSGLTGTSPFPANAFASPL